MNKFLASLLVLGATFGANASTDDFSHHFADSTLRLDYIFGGIADPVTHTPQCTMLLDAATRTPGWAGRRHNLKSFPLQGNGHIVVRDAATADTLYANSFSTLFQEWFTTDESIQRPRSFESTFLVPMPKKPVVVDVELYNTRHESMGKLSHPIDPTDILITDRSNVAPQPHRYLHRSSHPETAIDVAILAEGYTPEEAEDFYASARIAVDALLSHEPFKSRADDFNYVAVAAPSIDSGVSVPRLGEWKRTACSSNFSTFYSDRYLTTSHLKDVHDCLTNIPYEHIIILANTPEYGGGGIFNLYTLTTAGHKMFRPVVVHEFGHSFGGLADEYTYGDDDSDSPMYPDGYEPWEANITSMVDFKSKWADMLPDGTPVPTPVEDADKYPVGVYEGGGYRTKGVYRPADNCRMRTNAHPGFCPVCVRAIDRIIDFYVK